MIIKEFYRQHKDGVNLYRTYSDKKIYILQNEIDKPIEKEENEYDL